MNIDYIPYHIMIIMPNYVFAFVEYEIRKIMIEECFDCFAEAYFDISKQNYFVAEIICKLC